MVKFKKRSNTLGFTLLELIIVIAIVAVLAAIAVPSYLSYLRQSEFKSTVNAAQDLQKSVSACILNNKGTAKCHSGTQGLPEAIVAGKGTPGLSVSAGVIQAVAPTNSDYGVNGATYILTPSFKAPATLTWSVSGTGCGNDYAECQDPN